MENYLSSLKCTELRRMCKSHSLTVTNLKKEQMIECLLKYYQEQEGAKDETQKPVAEPEAQEEVQVEPTPSNNATESSPSPAKPKGRGKKKTTASKSSKASKAKSKSKKASKEEQEEDEDEIKEEEAPAPPPQPEPSPPKPQQPRQQSASPKAPKSPPKTRPRRGRAKAKTPEKPKTPVAKTQTPKTPITKALTPKTPVTKAITPKNVTIVVEETVNKKVDEKSPDRVSTEIHLQLSASSLLTNDEDASLSIHGQTTLAMAPETPHVNTNAAPVATLKKTNRTLNKVDSKAAANCTYECLPMVESTPMVKSASSHDEVAKAKLGSDSVKNTPSRKRSISVPAAKVLEMLNKTFEKENEQKDSNLNDNDAPPVKRGARIVRPVVNGVEVKIAEAGPKIVKPDEAKNQNKEPVKDNNKEVKADGAKIIKPVKDGHEVNRRSAGPRILKPAEAEQRELESAKKKKQVVSKVAPAKNNEKNEKNAKKTPAKPKPDFKSIHQKITENMESLDDYAKRKKERHENLMVKNADGEKSPQAASQIPRFTAAVVKKVEEPKTPARTHAAPSTPVRQNVLGSAVKKSIMGSALKENIEKKGPPPVVAQASTLNSFQRRKSFDINASLAKPLNYNPHTGKLKPLAVSAKSLFINKHQQADAANISVLNGSKLVANSQPQVVSSNRRLSNALLISNKDSKSNLLHETVRNHSNQVTGKFRANEQKIRKENKESSQMRNRQISVDESDA